MRVEIYVTLAISKLGSCSEAAGLKLHRVRRSAFSSLSVRIIQSFLELLSSSSYLMFGRRSLCECVCC